MSSAPRRRAAWSRSRGAPTTSTRSGARELREDEGGEAHGPAALHHHRVAEGDAGPLHRMEARGQAAAAAHEVLDVHPFGKGQDAHSRP